MVVGINSKLERSETYFPNNTVLKYIRAKKCQRTTDVSINTLPVTVHTLIGLFKHILYNM
jgi:hypothetical protein